MSETQVALRFPRASPRLCAPMVGGMGLWCSELPTSTSVNRFLARLAFARAGRLSPAWGSPRFLPACLPPCALRPGCPGRRPPDRFSALRVQRRISHPLGSVPPSASFRVFQRAAPPSTSPPVSAPGSARVAPLIPFGLSQPATDAFRPRGLSPPRRFSPPMARGLVASHSRSWGSSGFIRVSSPRGRVFHRNPHRCHTLQSFPHPFSRTDIPAGRCLRAVSGCVPGATRARRLQGLAPNERPLS